MAWSSLKPGGLRTTVLSRLTMHEETIPEQIAHAHEPRKLPVVLRRREGRGLSPARGPSAIRYARQSRQVCGVGGFLCATSAAETSQRRVNAGGRATDPELRIGIPAMVGAGPRLQNRSASKLALLDDHEPRDHPHSPKSNLKINGRSDGLPMWLSLTYDYLLPY
jgi:hypothetical protein